MVCVNLSVSQLLMIGGFVSFLVFYIFWDIYVGIIAKTIKNVINAKAKAISK